MHLNCIYHTGSYWSRKTQAAGRHNTHVQTGTFQGSCHFILGHYAPDMSVLYASLHVPTVCSQRGVPIITTGYLKSRENGNPGMPIFTGCVYFYDTGCSYIASFPGPARSSLAVYEICAENSLCANFVLQATNAQGLGTRLGCEDQICLKIFVSRPHEHGLFLVGVALVCFKLLYFVKIDQKKIVCVKLLYFVKIDQKKIARGANVL